MASHEDLVDLDAATAELILQLQLDDIAELEASSKGKARDGELTDNQLALQLYHHGLTDVTRLLADRRMATSVAAAVFQDGNILTQTQRDEQGAAEDHAMAHRLSGRTPPPAAGTDLPRLTDDWLAKLAGKYVSRRMGQDLCSIVSGRPSDEEEDAESSYKRMESRSPGSALDRRCVGCQETNPYFDTYCALRPRLL